MKLSQLEFKPGKRTKFVGPPPLKKPKLRLLLLLLLAAPVYFILEKPVVIKFFHHTLPGNFAGFMDSGDAIKTNLEETKIESVKSEKTSLLPARPIFNAQTPLQSFRLFNPADSASQNLENKNWLGDEKSLLFFPPNNNRNCDIRPILPGKLVKLHREGKNSWVKIYHGLNLYSTYTHFYPLANLLEGEKVGNILGYIMAKDSSALPFELQIEKEGLMISPAKFLNMLSE